ncbi:MGMT family protein [Breznakiella homolactica]|uniref:Methylated-DNA--[protein]-cysteine S-methyltransferase n=1 Tax=Breznakiella homolactica TaxID=2798577 RepID=A0A7T7XK21_9SPIR|nr:methylated-DNA--[protein]-cysteine S-methyltransferase [Breznakiella homolactica]QQO07801.1 methylated-DNA--[protein]-cysteine S-methyltransferase [Breznakiella homolactica]
MVEDRSNSGLMEMDETFLLRVYDQVAGIPSGKVCTYGKIAELAGYPGASREVGSAMSRVKEGSGLPCHRVVNKKGTLAPDYAFGGQEAQRALLETEGVGFLPDGAIDIKKHLWPEEPGDGQLAFDL